MKASIIRSPRKRKGHGAERRQEILDAALRLFSKLGIHAVSTREIAAAAGISQPALYAYFETRDEIAAVLCEQAFAELRGRIKVAAGEGQPDWGTFDRVCRVYINFGLEQPDAYRVGFMIEKAGAGEALDDAGHRSLMAGVEAFSCFREQVSRFVEAGMLIDTEAERVTQTVWAALHGLVSLMIARPQFPWVARDSLIEAHIALIQRGVRRDGSE